ncbi:calcium:proton antiporter [Chryseobacterium potabilaquae]|uniref:Sodium-potassium/proton antiporter ChaA n=1 Tax=Chryseobacterium potabilaquae TaxID=2675057 RepID=A0A6N4XA34_9FLAO|nr:ionic transporter y4hA [Chryseobacterium potabilaquae]CAA7197158.1 Sodium-potassium/proton antiporter ChaA [Chryseobacterium potabilaquae]
MKKKKYLWIWTFLVPILAWLFYFGGLVFSSIFYSIILALSLLGSVLAAVYHSEVIAHRLGEPFGTLLLAFAITVIEVGLIISIMMGATGLETLTLARDTVFAAVMFILTGIIGSCIVIGSLRYREQTFTLQGVSTALITLTAIVIFVLILPNYTISHLGGEYTSLQLLFIALISLGLYVGFTMIQTFRHRSFFISPRNHLLEMESVQTNLKQFSKKELFISCLLLVLCLGIVVLLAKLLSKDVERIVISIGAPKSVVGIIIAGMVLLPEGLAAFRAAKNDQIQTSLNLAFGSALASIGLSIPAIALISVITGIRMVLGIDIKSTILLGLSLFIITVSLATGRTNIMQGVVLIGIFLIYLFITIVP